ncbi:dihydrofolate reductase family protein [bacterium]|nr:MAG: dihydrofolate reductase family protein [bacterium]
MTNRPYTTLFLLQSLDGKISTGATDERDFDKDLPQIPGIKDGLHQYYDIEKQTDWFSFNSGRVMAKIGANTKPLHVVQQIPVCFVIVDNKPHLNAHGVAYMARWAERLFIVTTNQTHPAFALQKQHPNIFIISYTDQVDLADVFTKLKDGYQAERITIQSGGELNAELIRAGLIDHVLIVIAPCIIGGRATTTLVEGESLRTVEDLAKIRPLELTKCEALTDSYVRLEYDVINQVTS